MKQIVVIDSNKSNLKYVKAGVPQTNISGQVIFLVNINDLVVHIYCNITLFNDNILLFITVKNLFISAALLNTDLEKIMIGLIMVCFL